MEDLNLDGDNARMFHFQFIGCTAGQIDFASGDIGTAIVDFYFDPAPVLEVFDLGG